MKIQKWQAPVANFLLKQLCSIADKKFNWNKQRLQMMQRKRLAQILKHSSLAQQYQVKDYEQFKQNFPVSRYADWKSHVHAWKNDTRPLSSSPLVRFQPTSGSSEQIKFIPYTKDFLNELDMAIAPWLASLYRRAPKLANGKHYLSVSWLPESQREVLKGNNLNDDSALLGWSKRFFAKMIHAVPESVAFAANPDDALFATVCYLVAEQNLSLISVWSPTFALQLLERLQLHAAEIIKVLQTGTWGNRTESLKSLDAPRAPERAARLQRMLDNGEIVYQQLWPQLSLLSSWDTAGSKQWAKMLHQELAFTCFEGKGLWATEGVVTIPYNNRYPLAYLSHFYEFEYLSGDKQGQVVPSWQLQQGDEVSPIITSGNGLLRYCLDDNLKVVDFFGQVPCFEFQGRRFGVDLVGEKLAPEDANKLLQHFSSTHAKAISLLAVDTVQSGKPFYCLLIEGQATTEFSTADLDAHLRSLFHYELARDLGQLAEAQVLFVQDGWEAYKKLVMQEGMIEGNIKPEPLKKITLNSLKQFQQTLTNS